MNKSKNLPSEENCIKIILLDIFPSISELIQQKNELDIIFQGLDIFYNLFELLSTKKEITLKTNNRRSIIISLIKLNNLFATCVFNIKQGEHWITFSYENKKKKDSSFAQSLFNCIKIKLSCELINKNTNINNNSLLSNSKKIKYNLPNNSKLTFGTILTEDNNIKSQSFIDQTFHQINPGGKISTNKGNKKISLQSSPKEKICEKSKFSWARNNNSITINTSSNNHNRVENIINKKKNFLDDTKNKNEEKGLKRMNTKNSYSKIMDDDLAIRLNKMINKKDGNKLNITQRTHKNSNSNSNLDYSIKEKKQFNNLFNNFGANKSKQLLKNKLLYNGNKKAEIKNITNEYNNKKNETEISINNTNNYEINRSIRRKYNNKSEQNHDEIDNLKVGSGRGAMTNRRNKDNIKDLKNNTSTNAKTPEITRNKYSMTCNNKNTIDSDKYTLIENKNKNKDNSRDNNKDFSIYKNISSDFDFDNEEKNKILDDLSNNSNDENDNYSKLKEDFILLYNDNYVKNIQEDLLKLEIELFVEKMTGLISEYHYEINERKIENKIIENSLKKNAEKYLNLCKLYFKLNLVKKNYKKKYMRLLKNRSSVKDINDKNFETNKNEIEIFKLIFPNKKKDVSKNIINISDKKGELKKIISPLLCKNKTIFENTDLYKKWLAFNNKELETTNKDSKKENIKYSKPKARTRAIPKLQQTNFNLKLNKDLNNNNFVANENKSEKKLINNNKKLDNNNFNYYTHNPNNEIYSKNSAVYNHFYSRKIPK